jgi:tetratricopeptide (TPR) repeat protein
MTEEQETNETEAVQPSSRFPWLIALVAFLLYTITLNHWVSLASLPAVARITGWDWHPLWLDWRQTAFTPLYDVVTYPFRFMPSAWQPVALNVFSAACAALTLMLLARSVALLPHDRSRDQRVRELPANGLLSGFRSILPQVIAVLVCGLQITFWENATVATTETLDLLVFASLIWCLLEFRLSRNEAWVTRFVLLYGVGMTNNWALVGFFPLFLIALIWIKGLEFFEWKYIGRLFGWFCLGLLLLLLLPAVAATTDNANFWHVFHMQWASAKSNLLSIPGWVPLLLSVPTLIAVCFIGIRWPSFQGDMSALGSAIGNIGFRLTHLIFFAASLWMFVDIRYSPRALFGANLPLLTYYYLAALSVGYFAGYFLFVLTTEPAAAWNRRSDMESLIAKVSLAVLAVAAFAVPGWLAYGNSQRIQVVNGPTLKRYATSLVESLPPKGAIVLSDDHNRLLMVKAAYQSLDKPLDNYFIETDSMNSSQYWLYLAKAYPQLHNAIDTITNQQPSVDSLSVLSMLAFFNQKSGLPIYYLHPSFGFFFEQFYTRPRGLANELLIYPGRQLEPPALTDVEINANLQNWNKIKTAFLDRVPDEAKVAPMSDSQAVGFYCSHAANYWGVELQAANRLKEAGDAFRLALRLNANNHMAMANLLYNTNLCEKSTQPVDPQKIGEIVHDALQRYGAWQNVIRSEGPPDEPSLSFQFAQALAGGENVRQAYLLFERRLALRPGDFDTELALAKTYTDLGQPDKAIELIRQAETKAASPADKDELIWIEALSMVSKTNWAGAEALLVKAQQDSSQDDKRVQLLISYYRLSGLTLLREKKTDKAAEQFKKAIMAVDLHLAMLEKTGRSASQDDANAALFNKAELQSYLGDFSGAVSTLGLLIKRLDDDRTISEQYATALFRRAVALIKSKKYIEAREDYLKLAKKLPSKSPAIPSIYYGLGEIATQTNNKKEAIKDFKIVLQRTPVGTADYKDVSDRLAKLESAR